MNPIYSPANPNLKFFNINESNVFQKTRKTIKATTNKAPSYTPSFLINGIDYINHDVSTNIAKLNLILNLENDIKNHKELSIHLFALQCFQLYATQFQVTERRAEIQIGKGNKKHYYEAAHCATLPCLVVNNNVIFGELTHFYNLYNTTTELPKTVNEIDSVLDFKTRNLICDDYTSKNLREYSLLVLNFVAQGVMTPLTGISWYLNASKAGLQNIQQTREDEISEKIINNYLSVISFYQTALTIQFLQKLFFEPTASVLSEETFYLTVRNKLFFQMENDSYVIASRLSSIPKTIRSDNKITRWENPLRTIVDINYFKKYTIYTLRLRSVVMDLNFTTTQTKHATKCINSSIIQPLVKNYLQTYSLMSNRAILYKDYENIDGEISSYSDPLQTISKECIQIIKKAHSFNLILRIVLQALNQ